MRIRRLAVLAGSLILTYGTMMGQNAPPAPAAPPNASGPAAVDNRSYKIGPQDTLKITVYMMPDLSGLAVVQTDGMIALSLIPEPIKAEGLTPYELQNKLIELWKADLKSPEVTVTVQDVRSKTYKVMGLVSKPGTFPITRPIHVSEALADTGGFQPYANKKKISVIRGGGKQILPPFNWNDFTKGKNLDKDVLLENGDIIEVR